MSARKNFSDRQDQAELTTSVAWGYAWDFPKIEIASDLKTKQTRCTAKDLVERYTGDLGASHVVQVLKIVAVAYDGCTRPFTSSLLVLQVDRLPRE